MYAPEPSPETIVYFDNHFLPLRDARIGVLTHALHYGTGVFEGIRGYWDESHERILLFRLEDHYERWIHNCGLLRIDLGRTVRELARTTVELMRLNGFREDIYLRPLAYKSAQRVGVAPDDRDSFSLIAVPFGTYLDSTKGLHAGVSSWRRVDDNAIPTRGKICGSYVNSALASDDARRCGFDEAIFLTESGHVAEGATCNIFITRKGTLITPPPSDNILEGITRASVMEIARRELGLEILERSIDRSELYIADEIFFTGTAVEIGPITRVDHRPVGHGEIGPIAAELRRIYSEAAHGRLARYSHWVTPAPVEYPELTLPPVSTLAHS